MACPNRLLSPDTKTGCGPQVPLIRLMHVPTAADVSAMKERFANGLDRIDRVGGKVVARFWGAILGVAIIAVLIPMFIWAIVNGAWLAALVSLGSLVALAVLVKYLFSGNRRLTDFE